MSLLKDVITGVKSTLQQFLPRSKFGAWRPFEDIEEEIFWRVGFMALSLCSLSHQYVGTGGLR